MLCHHQHKTYKNHNTHKYIMHTRCHLLIHKKINSSGCWWTRLKFCREMDPVCMLWKYLENFQISQFFWHDGIKPSVTYAPGPMSSMTWAHYISSKKFQSKYLKYLHSSRMLSLSKNKANAQLLLKQLSYRLVIWSDRIVVSHEYRSSSQFHSRMLLLFGPGRWP